MPKEGPLIAFGQSVDSILSLSDAEFFASIEWEKSAPRGCSGRPKPMSSNGSFLSSLKQPAEPRLAGRPRASRTAPGSRCGRGTNWKNRRGQRR